MPVRATFETVMTVAQMTAADQAAPSHGVPSMTLMENAGRAVADEIGRRWTPRPVQILCGPGNNGGDGFIAARLLRDRGWEVYFDSHMEPDRLRGDAAEAYRRFGGSHHIAIFEEGPPLVVDALFGAGLSRPLEGPWARLAVEYRRLRDRTIAIDVPSGIDGDTGLVKGNYAFEAALTVTFVRTKPGHVLMPGRQACGELVVADIGMPPQLIPEPHGENSLRLISGVVLAPLDAMGHKYRRGHCLVVSGGAETTGAARLSARAAARAGAGLTTIAAHPDAARIHATHLDAVMVRHAEDAAAVAALLEDKRRNAVVVGPGLGLDAAAARTLQAVLAASRPTVIDADALTLLSKMDPAAQPALHKNTVLTPHEGEFARLFPDLADMVKTTGKLAATQEAARRIGAIVLFKGPDTVIAAPDGRAAIDHLSPPTLATAGTGDVLAGFIGGFLAQDLDGFNAACSGVYLHGAAAREVGGGLTADDLPDAVRDVVARLQKTGPQGRQDGRV